MKEENRAEKEYRRDDQIQNSRKRNEIIDDASVVTHGNVVGEG